MNRFVRSLFGCLTLVAVAGMTGCAKPEVVPTSGPHPALTPDQVEIYQKAPAAKYEILGTVTTAGTPRAKWDEKGDANPVFDHLKMEAGKLGANGILLTVDEGQAERQATAGYHGTFYQVPVKGDPGSAAAVAQAIFVIKKK